jgi:hypothetical protein
MKRICLGISVAICSLVSLNLAQAQSISGFSPLLGSVGDPVRIDGSGFAPGNKAPTNLVVNFNGIRDTRATATADNIIRAFVPAGASSGLISVRINLGTTVFSANNFTVINAGPYVTDFAPVTGSAGVTVGIVGVHFFTAGVTNVLFNSVASTSIHVETDTNLTAQAPTGVTSGPLLIISSHGSFSTSTNIFSAATNFFVPPVIKSFTPANGRSGTNVVISGTNFLGASDVQFGGLSVGAGAFTVQNNNTIQTTVPAGASSGGVKVIAPAGSFPTTSNFVIQPTISGFTPTSGIVGTTVAITGANFNVSGLTVKFGGVTAATPTSVTFGTLNAVVPSGATNAPITVSTVDGSMTSAQLFYLPPAITSFLPTNSPNTTVVLSGSNFIGASAVTFTGTSPVPVTNTTNNMLMTVTVPAGVITGPISITTPGGTANSGTRFFYGVPFVNNFLPTHGSPGTNVTIFGTNFLGATAVKFNGVLATQPVNVINNGQINTSVPAGATTGLVTVQGPGGQASSAGNFVMDSSDLSLTISDSPDPVFVGSNLVYTITIANNGSFNVPNVMFTNTLPGSVTLAGFITTQGSLNTSGNKIFGNLNTINSGGPPALVTLTVVPTAAGTLTDTASAFSAFPDPSLANNTASATTTVLPLPMLSIAALPGQVQVSWPSVLDTFSLQSRASLNPGFNWSNVLATPSQSGGSNIITEPTTSSAKFYRLKQ